MAEKVVCVTGASGLVASWLVKRLLKIGYRVRGTVRNPEKASHLWELDGARERLELLQADLSAEGAFDSIVEGCQGVFHVASPTNLAPADPEKELVEAAVIGTLNVLNSCKKSSTVKRVVVTSSTSTLRTSSELTPETVLDESIWCSPEHCRRNKLWYPLSKTLAEKAACDFAKSNDLDLVTVIPSFVIGPLLGTELRSTVGAVLQILKGDAGVLSMFKHPGLVHLDDVATAHILVYENPKASGRYVCSAADATNGELVEFLSKRYPEYKISTEFEPSKRMYKCFSRQKLEELGLQFKSMEQMFDDCVLSLKEKGLL